MVGPLVLVRKHEGVVRVSMPKLPNKICHHLFLHLSLSLSLMTPTSGNILTPILDQ